MILPSALLAVSFIVTKVHALPAPPPPPPKPKPPSRPSLAQSTALLSASSELAPLRNTVDTSAFGLSVALNDQLAVIGDPSTSTMTFQTLIGSSNSWQEVAFVNVSSLPDDFSNNTLSRSVEVAQTVALSSKFLLVSKVAKTWQYTDDCPEDSCQEGYYDTECCPLLESRNAVSLLLYTHSSTSGDFTVSLTQELALSMTCTPSSSGNASAIDLSVAAVTDIQTHFTSVNSFFTSVSWVEKSTSESTDDDASDKTSSYSSHSQVFFGSLSGLVASWDTDGCASSDSVMHQSTGGDLDDASSVSSSKMIAAVAVNGSFAVQGFHNDSTVGQAAGVVFCYVKSKVAASTNTADSWSLMQTLYPPMAGDDDVITSLSGAHFGSSVALQSRILAVGAQGHECVCMYTRNMTTWQLQSVLTASDGSSGGMFGLSLQFLNSNQLVVGSPLSYDANDVMSGAVFKFGFIRDLDSWVELSKIEASNGTAGGCFGASVVSVEEHLFLVTASAAAVVRLSGSEDVLAYVDTPSTRIFSMNFSDCATFTTCTSASFNETSNMTIPSECTSYSSCEEDDGSSAVRAGRNDSSTMFFLLLCVGAAVVLLPAVLFVAMILQQKLRSRDELVDDGSPSAAPVLRMTPLNTMEEGGAGSDACPGGSVGESPVGRPALASGPTKGRGSKSYSALTSQAQVEAASPLHPSQQPPQNQHSDLASTSTVGGFLNRLRGIGGSAPAASSSSSASSAVNLSILNSPGPGRALVNKQGGPFTMPAVVEEDEE